MPRPSKRSTGWKRSLRARVEWTLTRASMGGANVLCSKAEFPRVDEVGGANEMHCRFAPGCW
eukprot:768231-Hanusia_phi.AAC.2